MACFQDKKDVTRLRPSPVLNDWSDTPPTGAFDNALEIAQKDMPTAS